MTDNLPAPSKFMRPLAFVCKGLGTLILTSSENLSRKYAQHQARLAEVEVNKSLFIASNQAAVDIKKLLMEKMITASPEERLQIRQNLDYVEKDIRQFNIYSKALDYIPEQVEQTSSEKSYDADGVVESSAAWLDVFNEYARKQNESWRADLLARALALEATEPGAVGQRALWFIGTVDDNLFHAFAALLDVSPLISGSYLVPNGARFGGKTIDSDIFSPSTTLANIFFLLGDMGVIGDLTSCYSRFYKDSCITAKYDNQSFLIRCKEDFSLQGVIFSNLGQTIAKLYDPKVTPLGKEILNTWIDSIKTDSRFEFLPAEEA